MSAHSADDLRVHLPGGSRIALFGGSFDPPHRGHLTIARAAADRFLLDQVLFAPAARQPLKPAGACASFADRLAMTALACTADPRFAASTLDGPRPDSAPNYAADTLRRLRLDHPHVTLFNLVGIDNFQSLASWRHPHLLLELAEWIVLSRPGFSMPQPLHDPPGLHLSPAERARLHPFDGVHEDISSTALRQRLHIGEPCAALLPPGVAAYIALHQLYLPRKPDSPETDF